MWLIRENQLSSLELIDVELQPHHLRADSTLRRPLNVTPLLEAIRSKWRSDWSLRNLGRAMNWF
jgi:hypothetical protein